MKCWGAAKESTAGAFAAGRGTNGALAIFAVN